MIAWKRQLKWTMPAVAIASAVYGWHIASNRLDHNPPSYCAAQQRYISDKEFIQTAVEMYEREMNLARSDAQSGRLSKRKDVYQKSYQKWENSRAGPECCRVYRQDAESDVNRLLGTQEVEVVLFLDQKNRGDSQRPFSFSVCGDVLAHDFGFHPPANVVLTTRNYQEFISNN